MNQSPTDQKTQLTIRRTINAPRQRVFDAWTKPEHLKHWWQKEPGWHTEIAEVDLRVGGKYRLGMRDPEVPHAYVCYGKFTEIKEPEKLVYTWSWEPPGMHVGETLVTVEFVDLGDSTEVVVTHERFPRAEAVGGHTQGWDSCLGFLATYVEADWMNGKELKTHGK